MFYYNALPLWEGAKFRSKFWGGDCFYLDPLPKLANASLTLPQGEGMSTYKGYTSIMFSITAYQQQWLSQSPIRRAVIWSILSGLLFSLMSLLVKSSGLGLATMQVVFGRSLFGLLLILPWILYYSPRAVFVTDRWRLQFVRCLIGISAMSCTFYALAKLPLLDVTAINYAKPIFILLLAAVFLRERVTPAQWVLTVIGFIGILIVLRPLPETFDANYLIAVLAAMLVAFAITIVKELTNSETPFSVLAWFSLLSTVFSAPFAFWYWQAPDFWQWVELAMTGFFGIVAQFCVIRSYALAPASYLAPLGYINILFTGSLGFLVFGDVPDALSILGAAVIMASTFYLMRRKKSPAALESVT
jgi:drug/metabolite transporter (DMT)-like permease